MTKHKKVKAHKKAKKRRKSLKYIKNLFSKHKKIELTYIFALLFLAMALCYYAFSMYKNFYHDDAYISLKYCHNFINGKGLVWNESEYVEGYTNFLFIVFVSALGKIGIDLEIASQIVGILSYLGMILFCFFFIKRFYLDKHSIFIKYIPMVLIATSFCSIIWSLGGMETCLFALLCFISLGLFVETMYSSLNNGILVGISFCLAAMTRPEGLMLFVFTCIFILINMKNKKINGYVIGFVLSFLFLYGTYFIWRYTYYGDIFPNTFYVKAGMNLSKMALGVKYFEDFFYTPPYFGVIFLATMLIALINKRLNAKILYLISCIIGYTMYIIYVGGDHMPAFRFFIPLIPIISILLLPALACKNTISVMAINILVFFAISMQVISSSEDLSRARIKDPAAFIGSLVGKVVSREFPAGSLIALSTAGSTPYYAPQHRYIDMLGLNDRVIAKRKDYPKVLEWQNVPGHEKGDGKYVLSRNPDYIIFGGAEGATAENPMFLSDYEIANDSSFKENYTFKGIKFEDISSVREYQNYRVTHTGSFFFTYYQRIYQ